MFKTFTSRLKILITAMLVAGVILFGIGITYESIHVTNDYQDSLSEKVEIAYGVLAFYATEANAGRMTVRDAKEQSLRAIMRLRYGGSGYFWVNDDQNIMLAHPVDSGLVGRNLREILDANGKPFFSVIADAVDARQSEVFVRYMGPVRGKPDSATYQAKISYMKRFDQWGWYIGSGMYESDIHAELQHSAMVYGFLFTAVMVIVILCLVLSFRDVDNILQDMNSYLHNITGGYVDNVILYTERNDGFGDLARNISTMQDKFKNAKLSFMWGNFMGKDE